MSKKMEIKIWEEGAEDGTMFSMFALGLSYANGDFGLPQDDKIALEWYLKAVEKVDLEAMAKLAYFYDKGLGGLKQDKKEALKYY